MSFYPNFILIVSEFYTDEIEIKSEQNLVEVVSLTLSHAYPNFIQIKKKKMIRAVHHMVSRISNSLSMYHKI